MKLDEASNHDSVIDITGDILKHDILASGKDSVPKGDYTDLQKQLKLEPRAIVLAKVKGYRAWPAMVMDEKILPENIMKMKPKTLRLARKVNYPVINVPVRFFSDDTYIWIKSCELKVLSSQDINDFLAKRANSKKQDLLIDAYKLAKDPPDMGEFNKWGSQGPPQHVDSDDDDAEVDDNVSIIEDVPAEPERKKLKLSIKLRKPSSAGKSTTTGKKKKLQSSKPSTSEEKKPKISPLKIKVIQKVLPEEKPKSHDQSLEGFDSDWGLDDGDIDVAGGDYIFDDELEQKDFVDSFPRAADLMQLMETSQKSFNELHESISPFLLRDEWDKEKKITAKLRDLERLLSMSGTPIIAFTKSPLFRVLLLTLHKPETGGHHNIRKGIQRVFNVVNLQACLITEEEIAVATAQEDEKDEDSSPTNDGRDEACSIIVN